MPLTSFLIRIRCTARPCEPAPRWPTANRRHVGGYAHHRVPDPIKLRCRGRSRCCAFSRSSCARARLCRVQLERRLSTQQQQRRPGLRCSSTGLCAGVRLKQARTAARWKLVQKGDRATDIKTTKFKTTLWLVGFDLRRGARSSRGSSRSTYLLTSFQGDLGPEVPA
jgi:hypothetical protein